jgi:hypothetical protein
MVRIARMSLALGLFLVGCSQRYVPPQTIAPKVTQLQVKGRSHGTSFRCVEIDGVPWATDGRSIQILDARGAVLHDMSFGDLGSNAPITDLVVGDDFAAIVLEHDHVQLLDIADPRHPVSIRRITSGRLGLEPEHVAIVDGKTIVFGDGGAVRLDDLEHLVRGEPVVSVASAADGGWYITGRRIKRLRDGSYVGTASFLAPSPSGVCAFARNEGDAALLGVLGANAHEVNPSRMTVAVNAPVHRIQFNGNTLLALTQKGLHAWTFSDGGLHPLPFWPQAGLQDAVALESGLVLAVGEHGRSVLDFDRTTGIELHRYETAGGLVSMGPAQGGLVAMGTAGGWHFQPGRPVNRLPGGVPVARPSQTASMLNWTIAIKPNGQAVVTTPLGESVLEAPGGGTFSCVTATGSAFWLGHDRGIERIAPPVQSTALLAGESDEIDPMLGASRMSVRLGGPVLGCTPLVLGRGVAYVTTHDGFGLVVERKQHVDR